MMLSYEKLIIEGLANDGKMVRQVEKIQVTIW